MPEHTSCKGNYCEDVLVVNAFFHVIKDTSNRLEKVMKISHFNQTAPFIHDRTLLLFSRPMRDKDT